MEQLSYVFKGNGDFFYLSYTYMLHFPTIAVRNVLHLL